QAILGRVEIGERIKGGWMDVKARALEEGARSHQMRRVGHEENRPNSSCLQNALREGGLVSGRMRPGLGEDRVGRNPLKASQLSTNIGFRLTARRGTA